MPIDRIAQEMITARGPILETSMFCIPFVIMQRILPADHENACRQLIFGTQCAHTAMNQTYDLPYTDTYLKQMWYLEARLTLIRSKRTLSLRDNWWQFTRNPVPEKCVPRNLMLRCKIVMSLRQESSKYRLFVTWLECPIVLPDSATIAFRPRRRLLLRRPALQTPRSLVAAHGHLARQRQRPPIHAHHHIRDLSLPLVSG